MGQSLILVVEDDGPSAMVTSIFLEQFGYDCEVVGDAEHAVSKVRDGGYALVLMDIKTDGMDGLEATRRIREYEEQNHRDRMPIIGVTAYATSRDRSRCLSAGMDDYISKPFDPAHLQKTLQAYSGGGQQLRVG